MKKVKHHTAKCNQFFTMFSKGESRYCICKKECSLCGFSNQKVKSRICLKCKSDSRKELYHKGDKTT